MPLTFGEKIREARKQKKLTQKQLADLIGAAHNSISDWENNKNKPDPDTIELLCGVLKITPNYLLASSEDDFSPKEKLFMKKYRSLDPYGQETVSYILDREAERIKTHGKISDHRVLNLIELSPAADNIQTLPYWQEGAAAGTGIYQLNDTECIPLRVIDTPITRQADFIINVSGKSMEPDYYDGDKVLVNQNAVVQIGEIGIFIKNGKSYIKELGTKELISRNPKSDNIPVNEFDNVVCLGKVIGKVTDDMIMPD